MNYNDLGFKDAMRHFSSNILDLILFPSHYFYASQIKKQKPLYFQKLHRKIKTLHHTILSQEGDGLSGVPSRFNRL